MVNLLEKHINFLLKKGIVYKRKKNDFKTVIPKDVDPC